MWSGVVAECARCALGWNGGKCAIPWVVHAWKWGLIAPILIASGVLCVAAVDYSIVLLISKELHWLIILKCNMRRVT